MESRCPASILAAMKKIAALILMALVLSGSAWFAVLRPSESSGGEQCYQMIIRQTGMLHQVELGAHVRCPNPPVPVPESFTF